MAKQKKPAHQVQTTEEKRSIIRQLLEEYDIQNARKDLFGGTIKETMDAEMDNHLRYEKFQRSNSDNYHNS